VDAALAREEYGIELAGAPASASYEAVILAVPHREFLALGAAGIRAFGGARSVLFDVKGVLPREAVDGRL
jgi:UDP-N-acetyl-D-galactosamine dehydrogenase